MSPRVLVVGIVVLAASSVGACKDPEPREQQRREPAHREAPVPSAPRATTITPSSPSTRDDSLTPQPFHEQAEGAAKPAEATVIEYRATWANVNSRTPSCWFFSGPNGRDTPLGDRITVRVENGHAWVTWGKASFEGTWSDSTIDVLRLATHDYQGTWVIAERLVGRPKEKAIHARYTYEECQEQTTCPGQCSITADVLLVPK